MSSSPQAHKPGEGKRSGRSLIRIVGLIALLILVLAAVFVWPLARAVTMVNSQTPNNDPASIYLSSEDDFESLVEKLIEGELIKREKDFRRIAEIMDYGPSVRPGHYLIKPGLTSRELITPLRIGQEDPVMVSFGKYRTLPELASVVATQLALDSVEIMNAYHDPVIQEELGISSDHLLGLAIPNTYEMWWSSSARGFLERMAKERERFWDSDNRRQKAEALNLSIEEVEVIASIVEEEQNRYSDEWPAIAGVYLNRVRRGMRLEADPTVKFALGRWDIRRVLNQHKESSSDSPYNTYYANGLPPGPICSPAGKARDAVLNAQDHNYIFMCAKADFSGYHAFAANLSQHNRNARLYQRALDQRGIR